MFRKEEFLKRPNYLLTKYQNEIYRQLVGYINSNNLTQKDVAKKLGVSNAYVSQILNGNFNFTLKKLIEIGLMIGKIPTLEFIDKHEYLRKELEGITVRPTISVTYNISVINIPSHHKINHVPVSTPESAHIGASATQDVNALKTEHSLN